MEVSVYDATGLPQGCLLSVRAGSTRRQALVPLQEPLRFPNLPFNAKQFKVDVLKTLGSARLEIDGQKESASYSVSIDMGEGGEARFGFTVREEPALCGKRACELKQVDRGLRQGSEALSLESPRDRSPATGGEKTKAAFDTREYAKEHNIPNLVQEMLQYVLRERPTSPYSVMAAYLRRKAEESGEQDALVSPRGAEAPLQQQQPQQGNGIDPERMQLEAEHVALRAERAELMRELAALDGAALAAAAVPAPK